MGSFFRLCLFQISTSTIMAASLTRIPDVVLLPTDWADGDSFRVRGIGPKTLEKIRPWFDPVK